MDPAIPPIKIFGGSVFVIVISLFSLFVYGVSASYNEVKSFFKLIFVFYFVILIYVTLRILLDSAFDTSLFRTTIRSDLNLLAVFLYCSVFLDNSLFRKILNVMIGVGIFAAVAVLWPSLYNVALFLKAGEYASGYEYGKPFRLAFPSGNAFFGITVLYFIFFIAYCTDTVKRRKIEIGIVIKMVLLFLFGLLAGRTMFVSLLLLLPLMLIKKPSLIVLLSLLLFTIAYIVYSYNLIDENVLNWILRVLPSSDGQISSHDTDVLINMYTLKDANYIFGDGRFKTETGYYNHVDVGYLRNLYFGGVFFLLIIYSLPLIIVRKLSFIMKFGLLSTVFVLETKGIVLAHYPSFMSLFILISIYFTLDKKLSSSEPR